MQRGLIVACAQLTRVPAEILCIGMSNVKIKERSCMSYNAIAPAARLSQTRNPRGVWNIAAGDNKPGRQVREACSSDRKGAFHCPSGVTR